MVKAIAGARALAALDARFMLDRALTACRNAGPAWCSARIGVVHPRPEEDVMEPVPLLDCAGRRRSPATLSSFHQGRTPRNKGRRYPPDPPSVEEIIAVMRACGSRPEGVRLRAVIVVLWRAGLRISEALALSESDLDRRRGAVLVRHGKGGKRREVGMDRWAWEQLDPWFELRAEPACRRTVLCGPRTDPRATVRAGWDSRRAAPRRHGGRGPPTVRAAPAPPRARGRDVPRGHPAAGHPAPARARRPRGHQHLSARDRQHRDHPRGLRTLRPDDPGEPPADPDCADGREHPSTTASPAPRRARPVSCSATSCRADRHREPLAALDRDDYASRAIAFGQNRSSGRVSLSSPKESSAAHRLEYESNRELGDDGRRPLIAPAGVGGEHG